MKFDSSDFDWNSLNQVAEQLTPNGNAPAPAAEVAPDLGEHVRNGAAVHPDPTPISPAGPDTSEQTELGAENLGTALPPLPADTITATPMVEHTSAAPEALGSDTPAGGRHAAPAPFRPAEPAPPAPPGPPPAPGHAPDLGPLTPPSLNPGPVYAPTEPAAPGDLVFPSYASQYPGYPAPAASPPGFGPPAAAEPAPIWPGLPSAWTPNTQAQWNPSAAAPPAAVTPPREPDSYAHPHPEAPPAPAHQPSPAQSAGLGSYPYPPPPAPAGYPSAAEAMQPDASAPQPALPPLTPPPAPPLYHQPPPAPAPGVRPAPFVPPTARTRTGRPTTARNPLPPLPEPADVDGDAPAAFAVTHRRAEGPRQGLRGVMHRWHLPARKSKAEVDYDADIELINKPLRGQKTVGIMNFKGGVGKTTLGMCVASTVAEHRREGNMVIIDTDHKGSLARRSPGEQTADLQQLVADPDITGVNDVAYYMLVNKHRLSILGSSTSPTAHPLQPEEYLRALQILHRGHRIVFVDMDTSAATPSYHTIVESLDALIIPIATALDAAEASGDVMDWLRANDLNDLASRVVVLLNYNTPGNRHHLDTQALAQHYKSSEGFAVVEIPWDEHLAEAGPISLDLLNKDTRRMLVKAAAEVLDTLPSA